MNKMSKVFATSLISLSVSFSSGIQADEIEGIHPLLSDTFSFSAGGFLVNRKNKAKYGIDTINWEADLNGDNEALVSSANFTWRPFNKHQLQLEYFGWDDSSTATLNRSFNFDGNTYNINTTITASEKLDIYRLFYGYNLFKSNNYELGFGLGAHVADLEFKVSEASTGEGAISATAPVPNIGVYGAYAFNDKLLIKGRFDWLSLDVDSYDGQLTNTSVALQYQAFDNFGMGVLYSHLGISLEKDEQPTNWEVEMSYQGPSLFVNANF